MKKLFCAFLGIVFLFSCSKTKDSNPGGQAGPTISAISIPDGIAGDTVTITGKNFSATASENVVQFNGINAKVISSTVTSLVVIVPAGTTSGNITVIVNGQAGNTPVTFTTLPANVYIVASGTLDQSIFLGAYFRNGNLAGYIQTLPPSQPILSGIFVSNKDIYVCGMISNNNSINTVAAYWKNGIEVDLTDGTTTAGATSIWVSGTDVYTTGYDGSGIARYWKNKTPVNLSTQQNVNSQTNSIFISGNDIYISGVYGSTPNLAVPAYWKNGSPVNLSFPEPGLTWGSASSIYVSGSDVYLVGTVFNPNINPVITKAAYWKNGQQVDLTNGPDSTVATGLYINGTDIYISGAKYYKNTCYYWKNGEIINLTPNVGGALGISGNGTNIYIEGITNNSTGSEFGYWMNGTFKALTLPSSFTLSVFGTMFLEKAP